MGRWCCAAVAHSTQAEALVRLGIGLAVLPPIWALTLVLFLDVQ